MPLGKNPLVSIIMNCHNGEKFLKQSLKSVLTQSYKNWELIFWDNCSTDSILDYFKDKIFYYKSILKFIRLQKQSTGKIYLCR